MIVQVPELACASKSKNRALRKEGSVLSLWQSFFILILTSSSSSQIPIQAIETQNSHYPLALSNMQFTNMLQLALLAVLQVKSAPIADAEPEALPQTLYMSLSGEPFPTAVGCGRKLNSLNRGRLFQKRGTDAFIAATSDRQSGRFRLSRALTTLS